MTAIDLPRVAPPTLVTSPTREPQPFGLFSVASMLTSPAERWQVGVEWEPTSCSPAGSVSGDCFDPDAGEGEGEGAAGLPLDGYPSGVGPLVMAAPFAVYGSYECSALSRPLAEAQARADAHLFAWEEAEVERTITAGDRGTVLSLQGATDLTPAGGASVLDAVAILEGHLGTNYGSVGVLHVPRSAAAHGYAQDAFRRIGQRLETEVGNLVAAGSGYDLAAVGPDGNATPAGSVWIYATGRPVIRRSEVFHTPDVNFRPNVSNNDLTIFAWRTYLVAWECTTAAVLATLPENGGGE
jgi:hypothetical protein